MVVSVLPRLLLLLLLLWLRVDDVGYRKKWPPSCALLEKKKARSLIGAWERRPAKCLLIFEIGAFLVNDSMYGVTMGGGSATFFQDSSRKMCGGPPRTFSLVG